MDFNFWQTIIAGSLIAAAGGIVGSFALLRRMALVGDALSHVALPGIALGIIFHFNPFFGSVLFLFLGVLFVWVVEHKTTLPVDTLIGILFVLALAVGALLAPKEELFESLFGDITRLSWFDFWTGLISTAAIFTVVLIFSRKFTLTMISRDLAHSVGLKPHMLELLFLALFAFTVAIGIKFTGVLLMGSLIIIPPAISRNVTRSMNNYMMMSALFGILGAVLGILIAHIYAVALGPVFVIIMGTIFLVSLFFKR